MKLDVSIILGGDETVSLVSDTWSTDVLASDSETVEATQSEATQACLSSDQTTSVQVGVIDIRFFKRI